MIRVRNLSRKILQVTGVTTRWHKRSMSLRVLEHVERRLMDPSFIGAAKATRCLAWLSIPRKVLQDLTRQSRRSWTATRSPRKTGRSNPVDELLIVLLIIPGAPHDDKASLTSDLKSAFYKRSKTEVSSSIGSSETKRVPMPTRKAVEIFDDGSIMNSVMAIGIWSRAIALCYKKFKAVNHCGQQD